MFAPSRGRELKLGCKRKGKHHLLVRPLAGAGIEMGGHPAARLGPAQVRPLTGAGIEISAEAAYPAWL